MITTFPQCSFGLEVPELLSQNRICFHRARVSLNSKIVHYGIENVVLTLKMGSKSIMPVEKSICLVQMVQPLSLTYVLLSWSQVTTESLCKFLVCSFVTFFHVWLIDNFKGGTSHGRVSYCIKFISPLFGGFCYIYLKSDDLPKIIPLFSDWEFWLRLLWLDKTHVSLFWPVFNYQIIDLLFLNIIPSAVEAFNIGSPVGSIFKQIIWKRLHKDLFVYFIMFLMSERACEILWVCKPSLLCNLW